MKIFQALAGGEKYFSGNLNLITSYLPADVVISSFSATGNQVTIAGVSPFEQSISQFIVNLESDKDIESVTLTQVDAGEKYEGLIGFGLVINMKKGAL